MSWSVLKKDKDHLAVDFSKQPLDSEAWQNYVVPFVLQNYLQGIHLKNCLDIGCSYGYVSVPLSKYFETVYSFEMRKDIFRHFLVNTKDITNIKSWNYAISDQEGRCGYIKNKFSEVSTLDPSAPIKKSKLKQSILLIFKILILLKLMSKVMKEKF
jgi:FkbM family methyltransferase